MVTCGCGCGLPRHRLGVDLCYRYIVTDPEEIPQNNRRIYNPAIWPEPVWVWDVGGHTITDYTLRFQRGYSYHKEQLVWSRPKHRDSINSLDA